MWIPTYLSLWILSINYVKFIFYLDFRAIGGAILVLMICATVYEYTTFHHVKDVESSSSVSNNNDKTNDYVDKNLNQDRRISIGQENGQELIEKGAKHSQKENPVQKKERDEGHWRIIHLRCFCRRLFLCARISLDSSAPTLTIIGFSGFWLKCLLAFSPIVNGSKIISTEPAAKDSLTCLHGLRVFSLGWVVMVHTYLQVFSIAGNSARVTNTYTHSCMHAHVHVRVKLSLKWTSTESKYRR